MQELIGKIKDKLSETFNFEYATVRELEHKCFRVFYFVAGMVGLGFLLWITSLFAIIGIPLMVLGMILFFVTLVWMLRLQREPTREVRCPYCASRNELFVSRKEFTCDMCHRPVGVLPSGELVKLLTPEEEEARFEERTRVKRHQI